MIHGADRRTVETAGTLGGANGEDRFHLVAREAAGAEGDDIRFFEEFGDADAGRFGRRLDPRPDRACGLGRKLLPGDGTGQEGRYAVIGAVGKIDRPDPRQISGELRRQRPCGGDEPFMQLGGQGLSSVGQISGFVITPPEYAPA
jgi:hypothetical protein